MMCSKDLEDVLEVVKETGKVFYPRQSCRWDRVTYTDHEHQAHL